MTDNITSMTHWILPLVIALILWNTRNTNKSASDLKTAKSWLHYIQYFTKIESIWIIHWREWGIFLAMVRVGCGGWRDGTRARTPRVIIWRIIGWMNKNCMWGGWGNSTYCGWILFDFCLCNYVCGKLILIEFRLSCNATGRRTDVKFSSVIRRTRSGEILKGSIISCKVTSTDHW